MHGGGQVENEERDTELLFLQQMLRVFGESLTSPAAPYPLEVLEKLARTWKKAMMKETKAADGGCDSNCQKLIAFHEQTIQDLRGAHPHMLAVDHISYPAYCPALSSVMTCSAAPPTAHFHELSNAWIRRHIGIQASNSADRYVDTHRPMPLTACIRAGRCVCRGQGRLHRILSSRIDERLKDLFPRGPERKDSLENGLVILFLEGTKPEAEGDVAANEVDEPQHIYAHISLMYVSPWRPTFILLERHGQDCFMVKQDPNGAPACRTSIDLATAMDTNRAWSLQALLMDPHKDSTIAARDFCTLRASASDKPVELVWGGIRAERRARPAEAVPGHWAVLASDSASERDGSEANNDNDRVLPLTPDNDESGTLAD